MTQACSPRAKAEPFDLQRGTRIPRSPYIIRRRLGAGGMGEIYSVASDFGPRRLALKVLLARHLGRQEMVERLREEARLLTRLAHPHIVGLHDTGRLPDGRPYFVMDLIEGADLATELRRLGVLAVPTALRLALQALRALSCVHARGIVHRDVKLENLLLDPRGHLWLIDFGIARDMQRDARITSGNLVVGTPRVMAPEQFARADVDPRADVYAMGLVLYELLVGRGPFDTSRGSAARMRAAHEDDAPLPPSLSAPQFVSSSVDRLVLEALAKGPGERFASADAMARAVSALLTRAEPRSGDRDTTRRSPAPES